jgi:hypothetical protein
MTPKEKAEELVLNYLRIKTDKIFNGWWHKQMAKQCALIAVEFAIEFAGGDMNERFDKILYLVEVKHEIVKL